MLFIQVRISKKQCLKGNKRKEKLREKLREWLRERLRERCYMVGVWVVKNAISVTLFPMIQKAIKPQVLNKKTGKWEKVNLIPRGVWKEAGVPNKVLDKCKYFKR